MIESSHLEDLTAAFDRAGVPYRNRAAEAADDLRGYGLPDDPAVARVVELAPGHDLVFDGAGAYLGTRHEADGFHLFQAAGETEPRQREAASGWPPSEERVRQLADSFALPLEAWDVGRSEGRTSS